MYKSIILTIVTLSIVISMAQSKYVMFQYFNDNRCGPDALASGSITLESTCVRGYIYTCNGQNLTTQVFRDDNCQTPMSKSTILVDQCSKIIDLYKQSYTATCLDSYEVPENTYVNFDYTGECDGIDWKDNTVSLNYKVIGACQHYPTSSATVSCNSTDLITTYYRALDFTCSGSVSSESAEPLTNLNVCGSGTSYSEMNICNN